MVHTVLNWSSGKDAALAYYMLLQQHRYKVTHLLTTLNSEHERIFMHGVKEKLLSLQAFYMDLPLTAVKLPAAPDDRLYKKAMYETMIQLKEQGVEAAAFGDIFLEDLRQYRERQLQQAGMEAVFPLWNQDTRHLVGMMEDTGIEAIIVCVNEKYLGREFLGRKADRSLLNDLPESVDPCGENGEFHTFVCNAPFFRKPLHIVPGEIVYKTYTPGNDDSTEWDTGFYFLDLDIA